MRLERFKVLSEKEIAEIHDVTVKVLSETGVRVLSEKALDMLEKGGATVDKTAKTAKFSPGLIDRCIKSVPREFALYNREGTESMVIGDRNPKYAAGHNAIFMVDPFTNKRRYSKVEDIEQFGIIADKLTDIDIVGIPLNPQDVPPKETLLYAIKALYETTGKPLFFSTDSYAVNHSAIEMMKATAKNGDIAQYPNAVSQLSPTSPLYWEAGAIDSLIDTSTNMVPLVILPEPIAGLTAPYSVSGLLTMHNAETVSGIVISQTAKKGAPLLYGSSWTTYDMKNNTAIIGSPETTLLRIAISQMADYYNVPAHTTAPNDDANAHDEHMTWEKVLSSFCSAGARNDIIMNSGMFSCGLSISLEQLILDDEMNGYERRICRGINVTGEAISADTIQRIGHGESFMMEDLTFKNLRSGEFHAYKMQYLPNYKNWMDAGAPDAVAVANRKAKEYLSGGSAHPLDEKRKDALAEIIKKFTG
ncbi:MAG: trimethylamine methyltransferase family protein [Treponema sp.]|jgi:trimethylamine--corrinoid protein Co-methyltransferase|nr:trimethylamine methyltransferase family protein [Treponema sp.]